MIEYRHNFLLDPKDVARVFDSSGITRPTHDLARIECMFTKANLIVSAWSEGVLIGVCRALTDFSYCCYISDLAVVKDFQRLGIGKHLLQEVRGSVGEEVSIILISNPKVVSYYPKVGFSKLENGYVIKRKH
jgi:ribosomal protein S18 acetylase RimI-like enzyme